MKSILKAALVALMFFGLTACVIAPPYGAAYVEPGYTVIVPAPYRYGPPPGFRHHHEWDRRW